MAWAKKLLEEVLNFFSRAEEAEWIDEIEAFLRAAPEDSLKRIQAMDLHLATAILLLVRHATHDVGCAAWGAGHVGWRLEDTDICNCWLGKFLSSSPADSLTRMQTMEKVIGAVKKEVVLQRGIPGSSVFQHDVMIHGGTQHRVGSPCELCDALAALEKK